MPTGGICCLCMVSLLPRDKNRIERVQCRVARYVYDTYSRYSSVTAMLQSLDWETLESHRFNMRLCIIYKAYYNLAMFPLLDYATPVTVQTRGNNTKFILPYCSKDVFGGLSTNHKSSSTIELSRLRQYVLNL